MSLRWDRRENLYGTESSLYLKQFKSSPFLLDFSKTFHSLLFTLEMYDTKYICNGQPILNTVLKRQVGLSLGLVGMEFPHFCSRGRNRIGLLQIGCHTSGVNY